MDDVRERARIKREMAAHIRQIIPGLSAKEDRELLEKQVKTLEAEAIELERQAASAVKPPAVSITVLPPQVQPAPAPPVQAPPPPRVQVAPPPETTPPAARKRKAKAKPSSPAAPGKPKTRRR